MVKFVLMIKFKMDNVLLKPTIPSFHYSMIEAKTHASKNTLYFRSVVEIPRRLINRAIPWVLISVFQGI